ncbi:MAG: hypothetical protein IT196_06960 [Acidimicrobiales bacterium]|nr:hypothetical protein [Acidimicrobiales bacterium]
MTALFGREDDIREVRRHVDEARLVTLTGAGGVGKTRLAAAVTDGLESAATVHWADLAPIATADAVGAALLALVRTSEEAARPPKHVLADWFSGRDAVLVLDNCEHLLGEISALTEFLLASCDRLKVLATSREPLGVAGEVSWRVPSLRVPDQNAPNDPSSLSTLDSVQLFVDRARRGRPSWRLLATDAPFVAEIVRRTDGIPLAIELAAASCRHFSVEQVALDLRERFRIVADAPRSAPARQRTLTASIEWSVELLSDVDRTVLRRLSVFAGTFSRRAAEAILSNVGDIDGDQVVHAIARLVDKSLLELTADGSFRLLEAIRQYAAGQLSRAEEVAAMRSAHAAWWSQELQRLDARQPTTAAMELCNSHAADLRAALDWLASDSGARYDLLAQVALAWTWEGRLDDVLQYARAWLPDGAVEGSLPWARAVAACSHALFATFSASAASWFEPAWAALRAAGDAEGLLPLLLLARAEDRQTMLVEGIELGIEQRCDRLLCGLVEFLAEDGIITELPEMRERLRPAIARSRQRDPGPVPDIWTKVQEPAEQLAFFRSRVAPALEAADHRFVMLLALASIHGPLQGLFARSPEPIAISERFLARHGRIPVVNLWLEFARALTAVIDGRPVTPAGLDALELGVSAASLLARYPVIRVLYALDAPQRAQLNLGGIDRPGVARILGPVIAATQALHAGRTADAESALRAANSATGEHFLRFPRVDVLELTAVLDSRAGRDRRAARLLGAAERLRNEVGYRYRFSDQQRWLDEAEDAGLAALGRDEWANALAEGRRLDELEALAFASRGRGTRKRPRFGWDALTPTEVLVVELVVAGHSNRVIGEQLLIGAATVKTHVANAARKLEVANRTELAAIAAGARSAGRPPR